MNDSHQHKVKQKEVDFYKVSKPQKNQSMGFEIRNMVSFGEEGRGGHCEEAWGGFLEF